MKRTIRNLSDNNTFLDELRKIYNHFAQRGYPKKLLRRWLRDSSYDNRYDLLDGHKTTMWDLLSTTLTLPYSEQKPQEILDLVYN